MQGLEREIQYVKGVGPTRATLLQKLGINTLEDLITYYPRDYEDRSRPKMIASLIDGEEALIEAMVVSKMNEQRIRRNMTIYKLTITSKKFSNITCYIFTISNKIRYILNSIK